MSQTTRIVGLGGSLSASSTSLRALVLCVEGTAAGGAATQLFDVRGLALPMFDPSADTPAAATELCAVVADADGLLWSSPLYHGTISGSFKNALDWLQLLASECRVCRRSTRWSSSSAPCADGRVAGQLHGLGAEVVRAARQFHARGLQAADDECQGALAARK